jgi:anthranilate phosphoribosyltransferase
MNVRTGSERDALNFIAVVLVALVLIGAFAYANHVRHERQQERSSFYDCMNDARLCPPSP